MGSLVRVRTSAYSLVIALSDRGSVLCSSCLPEGCPIPLPGEQWEHRYTNSVHRWVGEDEIEDFLKASSWETYEVPRSVIVHNLLSDSIRGLGRELRSLSLFDRGLDCCCGVCRGRIFKPEEIVGSCEVEYHGVKIF